MSAMKGRPLKGGLKHLSRAENHENAGFAERSPTPTAAPASVAGNAPTEPAMFDHPHELGVLQCLPQTMGLLADLARSWLLFRH